MLNFINYRAQHFDQNGNPLSSGKIECYEAGTTNPKNLYLDPELTTSAGSVVILDAAGLPPQQLFMGAGTYKFVYYSVVNNNYVEIDTQDDIQGSNSGSSVFASYDVVEAVTDLRMKAPTTSYVYAISYDGDYAATSLGGGWFKWIADDVQADDGGSVIKYNGQGVGSYIRLLNSNLVYAQMFGMTPAAPNGQSTAILSCVAYIKNHPRSQKPKLVLSSGSFKVDSNILIDDISVVVEDGFNIVNTLSQNIDFEFNNCDVEWNTRSYVVTFNGGYVTYLLFNGCQFDGYLTPMNYLADGTGTASANDFQAFLYLTQTLIQSSTKPTVLIDLHYNLNASGYSGGQPVRLYSVRFEATGAISSNYGVLIGEYSAPPTATNLFRTLGYYVFLNGVASFHHFVDPNTFTFMARADYLNLVNSLGDNGKLRFDYISGGIWQIEGAGNDVPVNITNEFGYNNRIKCITQHGHLGRFRDSDFHCIETNSVYPIVDSVNPYNLGAANTMSDTVNVELLNYAVSMASAGSYAMGVPVWVDGKGAVINVNGSVQDLYTLTMNIKNLTLVDTRANDSATLVFPSSEVRLTNVQVNGGLATNYYSNLCTVDMDSVVVNGNSYGNVMRIEGSKVNVHNCKFTNVSNAYFGSGSTLLVSQSTVDGAVCRFEATSKLSKVSNCQFVNLPDAWSTGLSLLLPRIAIYGGQNITFSDNFINCLGGHSGENTVVRFIGSGSTVAKNLIMKSNSFTFDSSTSSMHWNLITCESFAQYGHNAMVSGNTYITPALNASMSMYQSEWESGSVSVPATPSSYTTGTVYLIFPKTLTYPSQASLYTTLPSVNHVVTQLAVTQAGGLWQSSFTFQSESAANFYFKVGMS